MWTFWVSVAVIFILLVAALFINLLVGIGLWAGIVVWFIILCVCSKE